MNDYRQLYTKLTNLDYNVEIGVKNQLNVAYLTSSIAAANTIMQILESYSKFLRENAIFRANVTLAW